MSSDFGGFRWDPPLWNLNDVVYIGTDFCHLNKTLDFFLQELAYHLSSIIIPFPSWFVSAQLIFRPQLQ